MQWLCRNTSILGALALAAALAGCSESTDPETDQLSSVEVADFGEAAEDEAEAGVDALSLDGVVDPAGASLASSPAPFSASLGSPPGAGCATVSSTTDTDGDGTPDNAVFTFALPACHFSNYRGGTLDLTGVVTVSDPTPTAADFNRSVELDDLTHAFANADATRSFTAVRNGTRQVTGSSNGITLNNNVTTERTAGSRPTVTSVHTLQLSFTPEEGSQIVRGERLPSGTVTVNGSLTLSRGQASRTLVVTTVEPLQYDASCIGPRRARIKAGEVHWTLPSGAYIRTVWSACGQRPERTFVPAA